MTHSQFEFAKYPLNNYSLFNIVTSMLYIHCLWQLLARVFHYRPGLWVESEQLRALWAEFLNVCCFASLYIHFLDFALSLSKLIPFVLYSTTFLPRVETTFSGRIILSFAECCFFVNTCRSFFFPSSFFLAVLSFVFPLSFLRSTQSALFCFAPRFPFPLTSLFRALVPGLLQRLCFVLCSGFLCFRLTSFCSAH